MKWTFKWGSHIPLLNKIMMVSSGNVLEFGMGIYSTPLLHWLCTDKKRRLVSYETDKKYFDLFQNGLNEFHETYLVNDLSGFGLSDFWGVVFIDSHPMEQRALIAKDLANNSEFIIVHDSEHREERFYHYREILYPIFKYRYDYTFVRPNTTVFSNFTSLDFLNE